MLAGLPRRQSKSCRTRNPIVSATSSQGYMSPRGTEHSRNAGQYLGHAPACLLADMYLPCNAEHQSTSTRRNQSQTCAPTHQPQTNHKNVIGARGVLNAAQRRAVNIWNVYWSRTPVSCEICARARKLSSGASKSMQRLVRRLFTWSPRGGVLSNTLREKCRSNLTTSGSLIAQ